jgi:hypothetical protein
MFECGNRTQINNQKGSNKNVRVNKVDKKRYGKERNSWSKKNFQINKRKMGDLIRKEKKRGRKSYLKEFVLA